MGGDKETRVNPHDKIDWLVFTLPSQRRLSLLSVLAWGRIARGGGGKQNGTASW